MITGVNLPSGRTPRLMVFVRPDSLDFRADVGRAIVLVVPHEISGDANLPRGVSCRFVSQVGPAKKSGQRLNTNVIAVNGALRARRDLANDRRRVADLRGMIGWLFENFEVPIVEIGTGAIRSLGRAGVSEHEPTGERDDFLFHYIELLHLRRTQFCPPFGVGLRVEFGEALYECGRIHRLDACSGKIDRGSILHAIALEAIGSLRCSFGAIRTIPTRKIDIEKVAVLRDPLGAARVRARGQQRQHKKQADRDSNDLPLH